MIKLLVRASWTTYFSCLMTVSLHRFRVTMFTAPPRWCSSHCARQRAALFLQQRSSYQYTSTLVLLHSTSHHSFLFIPNLFPSDVLKYLYIATSAKALKLSIWHICRQIAQRKHTRIYFLKRLQVIKLKAKFCSCEQKSRRSILPTGTVGISPFSLCQKVLRYQGHSCCHNPELQAV